LGEAEVYTFISAEYPILDSSLKQSLIREGSTLEVYGLVEIRALEQALFLERRPGKACLASEIGSFEYSFFTKVGSHKGRYSI